MAKATSRKIILGKVFEIGEELPEVGSLRLDQEWNIVGNVIDEDKLVNVTWLKDGTEALLIGGLKKNKVYVCNSGSWEVLN